MATQMNPLSPVQHKKIKVKCEMCGAEFERYPSQIREHIFCSRKCSKHFTSERMRDYNVYENPMNTSEGWSKEQKETVRLREQRNKGGCKKDTYKKYKGRHEHRVVAERILGRTLKKGEVVHHIDGDKHNNSPENLMVFRNQKDHVAFHMKGDDANVIPVN